MKITDNDVCAVIDARGGMAYVASVETGLANRFPFADADDRRRALKRALASGSIVQMPLGVYRRAPRNDD
ncbi:MAG: hypothetical protein ABW032_01235 [Burkholderiaceae bacterium]